MSSPHMGMYAAAMMHSPPPTSPPGQSPPDGSQGGIPLPHPYLQQAILYVSGLNPIVTDADLARALEFCVPFRPNMIRDGSGRAVGGTLEFKTIDKAEKALATLQGRPIPGINPATLLHLSPLVPTNPPTMTPPPAAQARLVKQLPAGYTDSMLYDLFRPFGSLASVRTQAGFGKDVGVVEFWREEDARVAEESMQYADIGGHMISVQIYHPRRASGGPGEFSPTAPPFIPSAGASPYHAHIPLANHYSPPRAPSLYSQPRSPTMPMGGSFVHGPGQQVQYAPLHGPGSSSSSGLIDPCNLFCKNLDQEIDSNGLFTHFRAYGQIVSARVMRNDNGQSRGFGFVSFQTPEQATAAMHAMNGAVLGSKQLVVRLHEPKQLRQEKLMQRYASGGHNGHPRSSSGATSPTPSEGGESYAAWGAHPHTTNYGPSHATPDRDRGRRGSGSYFNAALSGNLNVPMRYEDLYALTTVVRKEVITGELSRRIKTLGTVSVSVNQVDAIVDSIASLALGDVVAAIHDPSKLAEQVRAAQTSLNANSRSSSQPQTRSTSQTRSQDSRVLDPNLLNATASAPEHPSTPVSSFSAAISTPPRTSSPSPSVALPPTASEKDRLVALVAKLEGNDSHEIVDLLLSLSKKERALCLFNLEYLKGKVREAKEVLEVLSQEVDEPTVVPKANGSVQTAVPSTPQSKPSLPSPDQTPETRSVSGTSSNATVHTLATLARLPAAEIVRLASSPSATGLPLPKADPAIMQATNDFIDGVMSKPGPQQKQMVGEKLFKVIKAFGIKNSPKITISLLDTEDLRALAHLMNSYPSVLKEKVLLQTAVVVK